MKRKKLIAVLSLVVVSAFLLAACSGTTKSTSSVASSTNYVAPVATTGTIQMETGYDVGNAVTALSSMIDAFEAENPGIKVVDTNVGWANYQNLMQVKIAAGTLPDVFECKSNFANYSPYCVNLQYEPWVSKIAPLASQIVDYKGNYTALPMGILAEGLEYNVGILQQYGIDPDTQLTTIAQFMTACQKIHDSSNGSVYAMYIGGGDGWPLGLVYNIMADSCFVNNNNPDGKQLLNNTFNWDDWIPFANEMKTFFQYANPDYLTAKNASLINEMAQNKVAFDWGDANVFSAEKLNSNLRFSFVPLPAWKTGDSPMFVTDVKTGYGIWNKSTVSDDARLFLQYMAEPAQMSLLDTIYGYQITRTDAPQIGNDAATFAKYAKSPQMSIFCNVMVPSTVWSQILLDAPTFNQGNESAQTFADNMKAAYERGYSTWASTRSPITLP
jgi:raffinose/stachyose/melibiose transport system substrate-binding protein